MDIETPPTEPQSQNQPVPQPLQTLELLEPAQKTKETPPENVTDLCHHFQARIDKQLEETIEQIFEISDTINDVQNHDPTLALELDQQRQILQGKIQALEAKQKSIAQHYYLSLLPE